MTKRSTEKADLDPSVAAIAVAVLAALVAVAALAAPWVDWSLVSGRVEIDSAEGNAWRVLSFEDVVVCVAVSAGALLAVLDSLRAAIAAMAVALAFVVYVLIDPPGEIPIPSPAQDDVIQTVTIAYGGWVTLAATFVGLGACAYAARTPRGARRGVLATAALITMTLGGVAIGHELNDGPHQFYSHGGSPAEEKCAKGLARVADGIHNKGFARSNTIALRAVYSPGGLSCSQPNPKPNGVLSSRFVYQVKKGGNWGGCDSSNLQKNADNDHLIEVYRNYGQYPCGGGHDYRTKSFHGYLWDGAWRNGAYTSPAHPFG